MVHSAETKVQRDRINKKKKQFKQMARILVDFIGNWRREFNQNAIKEAHYQRLNSTTIRLLLRIRANNQSQILRFSAAWQRSKVELCLLN